jgi:DNA-binding IclR family transcriptional regulator
MNMALLRMDVALRLLVAIERLPQNSHDLAGTLDVSRPTVVRLVEALRSMGCGIEAVRDEQLLWAYHLQSWGVFDAAKVRRMVAAKR